jgi:HD-GYP domain-containing protein (c-di-GMP phosphodiesterase class II)
MPVRLAEVIGALSVATDLAMGQPIAFALRSCAVAVRLSAELGDDDAARAQVYYQALLRYVGCNAETQAFVALFGDEHELRRDFALVDAGNVVEVMRFAARHIARAAAGHGRVRMAALVAQRLLAAPAVTRGGYAAHCEVAQRLAERLELGPQTIVALGQLYERWDGKGLPNGLRGEAIAPAVRVVSLVQDAIAVYDVNGADAALAIVRKRRGAAYEPRIADRFAAIGAALLERFASEPSWNEILALEPGDPVVLSEERIDRACLAIADFADLKSPYTLGHSRAVAELAAAAAERSGLARDDAVALRRAALLHDVGSVGVAASIWGKPGPLTESEWERVRMHGYFTERVLAKPAAFARLGAIAAHHHERCDGSGYHRAVRGDAISASAKILAAADAYRAMLEPRPHRAARPPAEAAGELERDAREGRLDPAAVAAVLAAAGHAVRTAARAPAPAGLTERELDVLRLIARGRATKEVAAALGIAPKTADNHVQSIYAKTGVATRAGAALFAVEHGLLEPVAPSA